MPIEYTCELCGATRKVPPSQYRKSEHHFCSVLCRNRYYNAIKNKTLMTDEVREKLRQAHLNTGEGKTYTKYFGRHAHRIAAEKKLGRALLPGEVVHHIDGNRRNNSPENLLILPSQAEHASLHARLRKGVTP